MSEYPFVKYLNILNIVKIILLYYIEENLEIRGQKSLIVVPVLNCC